MCRDTMIEAYSQEIGEKESFTDHSLMISLGLIVEFIMSANMEGRLSKAVEQWLAYALTSSLNHLPCETEDFPSRKVFKS